MFVKGVIIAPKAKCFILSFAEGVGRLNSGMWLSSCYHNTLCQAFNTTLRDGFASL